MDNRWVDSEAAAFEGPLGECVYGSRLLGGDPFLVLHGGGNTSVKAPFRDITGRTIDALYVKGSGWDLATIEAPGFTPLPVDRLQDLLSLDRLSDPDMMRELSAARLDPVAPQPSVETLLHAFLPYPAVQHSHADLIVTLTNQADGEGRIREVFGGDVRGGALHHARLRSGPAGGGDMARSAPQEGPHRNGAAQPWPVHLW